MDLCVIITTCYVSSSYLKSTLVVLSGCSNKTVQWGAVCVLSKRLLSITKTVLLHINAPQIPQAKGFIAIKTVLQMA